MARTIICIILGIISIWLLLSGLDIWMHIVVGILKFIGSIVLVFLGVVVLIVLFNIIK